MKTIKELETDVKQAEDLEQELWNDYTDAVCATAKRQELLKQAIADKEENYNKELIRLFRLLELRTEIYELDNSLQNTLDKIEAQASYYNFYAITEVE